MNRKTLYIDKQNNWRFIRRYRKVYLDHIIPGKYEFYGMGDLDNEESMERLKHVYNCQVNMRLNNGNL